MGPNREGLGQGPKRSSKAICCYCVVSKINFIKQCTGSKGNLLSKSEENEGKVMKKYKKCKKCEKKREKVGPKMTQNGPKTRKNAKNDDFLIFFVIF